MTLTPALVLTRFHEWRYETHEMSGVCELAGESMTVQCTFTTTSNKFYDVLDIDRLIREMLKSPVSVERLAEKLAEALPRMTVTVRGCSQTHGWIASTVQW